MEMSLSGLLHFVVWIAIVGGVFWLLWWLIGYIGLPEPFNKVARVIVAIVCVVILINFLLGIVGQPIVKLR
jgi:uncharacterized membrane protein